MPSAKSILGIDLRGACVKVVEIEKKGADFAVKNQGIVDLPQSLIEKHPQFEDAKADALRNFIQANSIKTGEAVVVVGGEESFVKLYTFAEVPRREDASAVKWKLAEEIPFPIEEAICDFYPLHPGEPHEFVAACIKAATYFDINNIVCRAGLRLAGITILPSALQETFRAELSRPEDKIVSAIYMGKDSTNISIFRLGKLEFNRELPIGGNNITRAMSGVMITAGGKIEVSPEEAEKIKMEYGVPVDVETFPKVGEIPISQLQAMVRPALEKIQGEIARTFEYYKSQTGEGAIDRIVLTGGGSWTKNLPEFLSAGLRIPIVSPEPINPRLSAALGAALSEAQKINLLPEDVKYHWRLVFKRLLTPRNLFFSFSGLLTAVYLLLWLQVLSLQWELNFIDGRMAEYRPRLARLEAIEKTSKEDEKRKLALQAFEGKRRKSFGVLEEITKILPESVTLTALKLTAADLHLWGTAFEKNETAENIVSRFVLLLSSSPDLDSVILVQAVKNDGYLTESFNFEITGKIRDK